MRNGGYSVLFYENPSAFKEYQGRQGIARCWAYPIKDRLYLFNGYGLELEVIAKIVATALNLPYRYNKFNASRSYVNGKNSYVLANPLPISHNQVNARYMR